MLNAYSRFLNRSTEIILGRHQFEQEEENIQCLKVSQERGEGELLTGLFPRHQHVTDTQGPFPRLADARFQTTALPATLPNNDLPLFPLVLAYFLYSLKGYLLDFFDGLFEERFYGFLVSQIQETLKSPRSVGKG